MNFEAFENISSSQKITAVVLLAVMIVGGFVYFIFLPKKAAIDVLKSSIYELNRQINNNEVKLRRLDQLKVENKQLQSELSNLQAQLPAEQEVSGLLKQISDLSVESGLDVKLWKPGGRKNDPSGLYTEIPVDVEVSGGYHALAIFFDKVSKLPRIVNITNLNMENTKIMSGNVFIQNKFIATTFAAVSEGSEPLKAPAKEPSKEKQKK